MTGILTGPGFLKSCMTESRESSDRWVATVGRGGLMRGPPGEQTSGSLLAVSRGEMRKQNKYAENLVATSTRKISEATNFLF